MYACVDWLEFICQSEGGKKSVAGQQQISHGVQDGLGRSFQASLLKKYLIVVQEGWGKPAVTGLHCPQDLCCCCSQGSHDTVEVLSVCKQCGHVKCTDCVPVAAGRFDSSPLTTMNLIQTPPTTNLWDHHGHLLVSVYLIASQSSAILCCQEDPLCFSRMRLNG